MDRPAHNDEGVTLSYVAERLHDSVQQSVTGIRLLARTMEKRVPADATALQEQLAELQRMLSDCSDELYAVIKEIRTGVKQVVPKE